VEVAKLKVNKSEVRVEASATRLALGTKVRGAIGEFDSFDEMAATRALFIFSAIHLE
jgi:hypothetical protein